MNSVTDINALAQRHPDLISAFFAFLKEVEQKMLDAKSGNIDLSKVEDDVAHHLDSLYRQCLREVLVAGERRRTR